MTWSRRCARTGAAKAEWALLRGGRYDRALVNCDADGDLWKTGALPKRSARFPKKLGIAPDFHDLCHAYGSQLIKAGVDATTVSVRLGRT